MRWLVLLTLVAACVINTGNSLVARATFDMDCPEQQLQWHKLNDRSTVWGVNGCGRRATYVYNMQTDQWIMNASADTAAPAVAPQSGPPGAGTQQGVSP